MKWLKYFVSISKITLRTTHRKGCSTEKEEERALAVYLLYIISLCLQRGGHVPLTRRLRLCHIRLRCGCRLCGGHLE